MGRFALLAALIIFWATPGGAQLIDPEISPLGQSLMLNNVVRIYHGVYPSGYGLIIGRVGDALWVATAAHVVIANDQVLPVKPFDNISVQINGDTRHWSIIADPVPDSTEDLAFLSVNVPRTVVGPDAWRESVLDEDIGEGDRVRLGATPGAIGFTDWSGKFVLNSNVLRLAIDQGFAGQSGVPVMTARGVVGIYLRSDGERAVAISRVRTAAKTGGFPWMLSAVEQKPFAVKLCLLVNGAAIDQLRVNSLSGSAKADSEGCFQTSSGQVVIAAVATMKICSPETPNIPRERQVTLTVACRINAGGLWLSDSYGVLELKRAGEDRYTFEGLNLPNYGWIRGSATRSGDHLQLRGDTQIGNSLTGELSLTDRRMWGQVQIDGTATMIEVQR